MDQAGQTESEGEMNRFRFLVTFQGDERTHWRDGAAHIESGLQMMARTFAQSYSTGSIPFVTVELLPEAAVPAASGLLVGGGACAPASPATDPASSGQKGKPCP